MSRHASRDAFVPTPAQLVAPDGALFHDRRGEPVPLPEAAAPLADTHGHLTSSHGVDAACAICRAALAGVRLLVVPLDPVEDLSRGRWASAHELLAWLDEQVGRAAGLLEALSGRGLVPPPAPVGWEGAPELVDNVRIVAGAHPYGAAALDAAALRELDALLDSPRCAGVGEIGVDLGPYNELGPEVQRRALERQLAVARERGLPVELHIRDAKGDATHAAHALAARVLEETGVPEAGCDLHCFTDGPDVLGPFARLGCHVAFGGAATFASSGAVRDAVASCPDDLLLSETDSPYMAPVPLRGQTCEPAMVALSASLVADVRAERLARPRRETYDSLWRNACALLGAGPTEGEPDGR